MLHHHLPTAPVVETPSSLLRFCPAHVPTPLLHLPRLAVALGVAAVLAKDEGCRPLGSFALASIPFI